MNLEMGIQKALNKQAILFVGAGFASEAVNISGKKFILGSQLATLLAKACHIEEDIDLDEVSDIFVERHGKNKLITLLKDEYTVKSTEGWHEAISSVPWKRVYTTNYDNILESCYAKNKRKLTPITLSDRIEKTDTASNLNIHLNGYIERLNPDTLMQEFKLTNTSYLTSSFLNSPWISLFRSDIKLARVIFFIGYSLYDLDIKRVLFESEELKQKCFFITEENPSQILAHRIQRFGSLESIGVKTFANKIKEIAEWYQPEEIEDIAYSSFEKIEPPPTSSNTEIDNAVFDLLLYGRVDRFYLWRSMHDASSEPYFIWRESIDALIQAVNSKKKNFLLHSELGNGKTLFVEGISLHALEAGMEVYILLTRRRNIFQELDYILNRKGQILLVVENYQNYFDLLEQIRIKRGENIILLLSARSVINDVLYDRLDECLGYEEIVEFDLNQLNATEVDALSEMIDHYGLWKKFSSLSPERKKDMILKECRNEFQGVLISVISSPEIKKRFIDVLSSIAEKKDYYQIILAVLILDVISVTPNIDTIMELLNTTVINTTPFRTNPVIRQVLDIQRNIAIVRSSVLARFLLTTVQDTDALLGTLVEISTSAANYSRHDKRYQQIFRDLMVYSMLTNIFPEKGRRPNIIKYYERVKNLDQTRRNPYFWLQYAIARLFFKEYEKAGAYFDTAYSLAKSVSWFNPYQIDNHYSRYLLERAVEENEAEKCMRNFREAHLIIRRQVAKDENRHYPFRVASNYYDFYHKFYKNLRPLDQEYVISCCLYIVDKIQALPNKRRQNKHVQKCEELLDSVLKSQGT